MNEILCRIVPLAILLLIGIIAKPEPFRSSRTFASPSKQARIGPGYGRLPLQFEVNAGQTDPRVKFVARGTGTALLLTAEGAVLKAASGAVRMKLAGANPRTRVSGLERLEGRSNYFLGNDPGRWRTKVENFARVKYESVYPGIDLVWYGNQQRIEHDFILAPGADPRRIEWSFEGVRATTIARDGSLRLEVEGGDLRLLKPVAWQDVVGGRRSVACEFSRKGRNRIGFTVGEYDRRRTLVIDPVLLYSTYLGGAAGEDGWAIAVDKDNSVYLTGSTNSLDFPGPGPIQPKGDEASGDAFVLKLNPAGNAVVYAAWLGGNEFDEGRGIAVDANGNAFIAGYTTSKNFPITAGSLQPAANRNEEAFVAKINPAGTALVYSTYLGGSGGEAALGLALDAGGNVYLAGSTYSDDLLSLKNATGIQNERKGSLVYRSANRAGAWSGSGKGIHASTTLSLAVDPKNPSVIYAGTIEGGVFRSANGGATWTPPNSGNSYITRAIAIDPVTTSTLYAASVGGVARSVDAGQTWQLKFISLNGNSVGQVNTIAIDPVMPATIYAGAARGAFVSFNGGETWAAINAGLGIPIATNIPAVNRLVISPANRMHLFAATSLGFYKSTDGGAIWNRSNMGLPGATPNLRTVAIDPKTPATLYAATSFGGGVYQSTDGGDTWSARNAGLPVAPGSTQPLAVLDLAVDPVTPSILYAGSQTGGLYKSTDGAATWSAANTGVSNTTINTLAIDPANPVNVYAGAFIGFEGFAAKLNPAGSALAWLSYLGGSQSDQASAIAVDNGGNAYVAGSSASPDFSAANPLPSSNAANADAFITKINPAGTTFVYSSRFGGSAAESVGGVAVTASGQPVIVGTTSSADFPVASPLQPAMRGTSDAFVAKINPVGNTLEFSTWFGGTLNEMGAAIALDGAGNLYLTDSTNSTDFPISDAFQNQFGGGAGTDAFVARLAPSGSALVYSSYLGGGGDDLARGIAVDAAGNAYITGTTQASNFPLAIPLQQNLRGDRDVFISKIGVRRAAAVSAASYSRDAVAPDSIVAIFGTDLSQTTEAATTQPLPVSLGGASVSIESNSTTRPAQFFFASPNQINLLVPAGLPTGDATFSITSGAGPSTKVSIASVRLETVAPGLFTANASGQGVAAAVALRVKADGSQVYEAIARFDAAANRFVSVPIDVSNANEQVFLLLFGTGLRNNRGLAGVSATIGGAASDVLFAGSQGGLAGLDQVNLRLSRSLTGRGEMDLVFNVEGKRANMVRLAVK
jgi:uncharacterized protein (TIGR03437 family)